MSKRETMIIAHSEIEKNKEYINEIRNRNVEFERINGRKPLALTQTYGCQMNEHDSEKLKGMLSAMNYGETDNEREADLIIYNTCCIRENAELKVFGNLGHLKSVKRRNPDLKIAVCGCMMQQPHIVDEIKGKYPFVNLVFGTHNLYNFPSLLSMSFDTKGTVVEVWETEGEIIEGLPSIRKFDSKAFVNIMYGCNNFCSYCIVPYTRGRERSRSVEDILGEITDLVSKGVKEVTLLGQNVNSYGIAGDDGRTKKFDFADLLVEVNKVEGLERIRFMTSHPKDISFKLIDTMSELDKVCEQLHLPVQSGSNEVLRRMNRNYTREKYFEIVDYARKKIPGLTISTDLIVGFPGETDQDAEDTLDLIERVEFDSAFTFIYSKRKGTPACEMEDQVPEDVKSERFNRLLERINSIIARKNMAKEGNVYDVLVDGQTKSDDGVLSGRSRHFDAVTFRGDGSMVGKIVKVRITEPKSFSLTGEIAE